MTHIIRRATIDDITALINLRKLLLEQGESHYVANTPAEQKAWQESYKKWLLTHLYQDEYVIILVGQTIEGVISCVVGIVDQRVPLKGCLNGRMGWVQTLVVHPRYRRKGLAKQMLADVFEWFKSNDVNNVMLQTTAYGKEFYQNLGFINTGEELLMKQLNHQGGAIQ